MKTQLDPGRNLRPRGLEAQFETAATARLGLAEAVPLHKSRYGLRDKTNLDKLAARCVSSSSRPRFIRAIKIGVIRCLHFFLFAFVSSQLSGYKTVGLVPGWGSTRWIWKSACGSREETLPAAIQAYRLIKAPLTKQTAAK